MIEEKYVVDTSVIIERAVSKLIEKGEISGKILIPRAVIAELENQANLGKETGLLGLDELQTLQKLKQENKIELDFIGTRPNVYQIKFAKTGGEIDAIIREIAYNENAILITADHIQAQSAKAFGIEVKFITFEKEKRRKFILEKFFDSTTMSIHLKENSVPTAKKGKPGNWNLIKLSNNILPQKEIQNIAKEIVERARSEPIGFVEISRQGSTIVQYDNYRIVIVRPPVSDGWEITAVRPIKKLNLDYYKLPEKISTRIKTQARGIIVAGETGSGKCLPKNTIVYTKNGRKLIQNISKNDEILCINEKGKIEIKKVSKTFKRKVNQTIKIKTNFGKEIETTIEHPLLTIKDGKPGWINAKYLKIGDRIATIRKLEQSSKLNEIDWINKINQGNIAVITKEYIKEIPIEEFYKGRTVEIIKILKEKKYFSFKEIQDKIGNKSRHLSQLIDILEKDKVVKINKEKRRYIFSLIKSKKKIEENDRILLKNLLKYLSKEEIYKITKFVIRRTIWHECSKIKPVKEVNQELAELIGYLIGESLTKYGISTDNKIALERFKKLSKDLFNIEIKKSRNSYDYYDDKYGTINEFMISCLELQPIQGKKKSRKHRIPSFIFSSPNYVKASLLRSYFDCESYIHPKKGIEVTSASKGLIKDIQALLLYFGINSTISTKRVNDYDYTRLYIYGYKNVKKFNEDIGFMWKIQQSHKFMKDATPGSPNKDTIPIGPLVHNINLREKLGLVKNLVNNRAYSIERAQSMLIYLAKNISYDESILNLKRIGFMISENIQWDIINEIDHIKEDKTVYDLEVPYYHNFLAGDAPFIVHNSTFAQSIAEYYSSQNKIVKTVESPRDLQLSDSITQYSKSYTSSEEIHDILFLSRPDNIIFDEVRDTPDFRLYIDLRLAGSNCLGVLHSASPIDAIQRFIKRVDTGMIPSVLDTLIFIEKGNIGKVLTLRMIVKVPNGMTEADLARPIVEVIDFETNKVEYEIYSYGEETVVIPITDKPKLTPMKELAQKQLQKEMEKYVDDVKVEVISDHKANVYVPNKDIARIIGKQGKTIEAIEKKIGINIDVKELKGETSSTIDYKIMNKGKYLTFYIDKGNQIIDTFINDQFLFTSTSSKKGEIKIHKQSKIGQAIVKAIRENSNIELKAGM